MLKPIPIFKFAFAAYAATAQTGAERAKPEPEKRQPFETAWRSTPPSDGVLLVKIGVLDNGRALATMLTPCESIQPVREIWLGQIKETAQGYNGAVCMTQTPLRGVDMGQRIDFGPAHILDWTISYEASPECAALQNRSKPVRAACEPCGDCALAEEARG
jgi:hypothetical protein